MTGMLQHSEAIDRRVEPGRVVAAGARLRHGPGQARSATGPVPRRRRSSALISGCTSAWTATTRTVHVRTTSDGTLVDETEHPVAAGSNEIEWSLDIDRPDLWWPRTLGEQPLTDIDVELLVDGVVSDRRSRRTGLREVAWNDWVCSINGERIFLKAANVLPTRPGLASADVAAVRRDVELAVEAGLDALRVAGPHRPPRGLLPCRRRRCAAAPGLPTAVGLLPTHPPHRGAAGPRSGQRPRSSPRHRPVVRP